MKNLRFISGLSLGLIIGVILFFIVTCKTETTVQTLSNSSTLIDDLDNYPGNVYKLSVDNIQYLVVDGNNNSGIAIIKHQ
jgi:hypothetical protein